MQSIEAHDQRLSRIRQARAPAGCAIARQERFARTRVSCWFRSQIPITIMIKTSTAASAAVAAIALCLAAAHDAIAQDTSPAAAPATSSAAPASSSAATPASSPPTVAAAPAATSAAAELKIIDRKVGTGKEAQSGKAAIVQYTGWLYDEKAPDYKGREFDSSSKRGGLPLGFIVGVGRVIKGWDQGVLGMKVGGSRTLIIPAALAYGDKDIQNGLIPPNSALVFDIELVEVKP